MISGLGLFLVCLFLAYGYGIFLKRSYSRRRRRALPAPVAAPVAQDRWKSLEAAHSSECLRALTPEDVAWLKWWGWEPPPDVERRIHVQKERARRAALTREEREQDPAIRAERTISTWRPSPRRPRTGTTYIERTNADGTLIRIPVPTI